MRKARALLALGALAALCTMLALALEGMRGGGDDGYAVRAIFDNSSFVIPGEDVKVAGVTVGTIKAVQLTEQNKAALVLSIDDPKFRPFRADAHCEIGLESLLGEQFVQCTPTQPRAAGVAAPPALPAIASGPDRGQHLLPVQNTTTPVGFDLIGNITRLPEQQRLQLIISGLGAGLAGNGAELNAALRRADPALQQTDEVIAVLARQDEVLAQLIGESDRILAPLSAQRAHIGGFVQHAGRVALASAQEGAALEQNLQSLPPFLRQLRPAAVRLSNLAAQLTPALRTLAAQAPAINASLSGLGPLARSSIPAVQTLGDVARRGQIVFPRINRVAAQLRQLSEPLLPLATDIAATAGSFDNAGGIEDAMRFIYYYTGTINGEDALGHYIRSHVVISNIVRTSTLQASSSATFACTTGAAACGRSVAAGVDRATPTASPVGTAATASARALLDYLLAP